MIRSDQPVIPYLLKKDQEEEKRDVESAQPKPVGFIGLEDDEPIGGFIPKRGIGGTIKDDSQSGKKDQIWAGADPFGFS